MIYQISSIPSKTQALAQLNKGLLQARHIQARLKESAQQPNIGFRPTASTDLSLLPVNSWFD